MHEKVKSFLEQKKDMEKNLYQKTKQKTLIELELYEKIYSPNNSYSEEYCFTEYNETNGNKYFKKVAIEVTDEEFEEIKKYSNIRGNKYNYNMNNSIAKILMIIAWIIYILGFITGIYLGVETASYYDDFSFPAALVCWIATFLSGTTFLGFSEIIELLDAIKNK